MSWRTGYSFHCFDAGNTAHLYVIIAQDKEPPERCLVTNITTIRNGPYDKSCVLDQGDHKCITGPSWVFYRRAAIWKVSILEDKRRSGEIWQEEDECFDWKVLMKIQQGGSVSDQMSPDNKDFLTQYLKI